MMTFSSSAERIILRETLSHHIYLVTLADYLVDVSGG